ncbi:hypothetical protein WJX84_008244 [Apatococcus fuscideae]|uniref:Uncharacterized protein n=1 Tax=Apatococcus fuscideae TaxID=2026836 RepID=A0AAW1SZJ3_9CHLO
MAGAKTKSQLRVLLAGHSSSDLRGAKEYLQGQGCEATVCLNHEQARKALLEDNFDVAVVEVRSTKSTRRKAHEVDGLKLLALENVRTPVAVATTVCNERSMVEAVELGAVDILRTPIASQQDRLATLWQHAVRKGKGRAAIAIKGGSHQEAGSFPAADAISEADACLEEFGGQSLLDGSQGAEDLLDGFLPGLFSPEHVGDIDWCLEEERQGSIPTPDTPDNLSYDRGLLLREDSTRDRISCLSAVPSDGSMDPSCLRAHSCASALVPSLESQPTMVPTGSMQGTMSSGVRDSDSLSTFESDCTDGDRASKKQKVEWTDDLHDRFVIAVETLGADSAVPSKILEIMGPVAAGLTRQNIASHLQKFRYSIKQSPGLSRKRSRGGSLGSCRSQNTSSGLPPLLPAPTAGSFMNGVPCWPGLTHHSYGHFASWPSNSLPFLPVPLPTAWCPTAQATLTAPREQVSSAIQEVLGKPQGLGPLGLQLDASSLLMQLDRAQPNAVNFAQ